MRFGQEKNNSDEILSGVTLLRAAAKNHSRVTVLSDPADYHDCELFGIFTTLVLTAYSVLAEIEKGEVTEKSRQLYALKAFEHTADYDQAISNFFRKQYMSGSQHISLRYGTNPHQKPASAYM